MKIKFNPRKKVSSSYQIKIWKQKRCNPLKKNKTNNILNLIKRCHHIKSKLLKNNQ